MTYKWGNINLCSLARIVERLGKGNEPPAFQLEYALYMDKLKKMNSKKGGVNREEKIVALEERVAALEGLSQKRQSEWDEVVAGWKITLREFCRTYGLKMPEELKETE